MSRTLDPVALTDAHQPPLHIASIPTSVQPGGGFCFGVEASWGKLRRGWLRTVRRGYVRHMASVRQGECPGCTHDIIDPRDLKNVRNVCGYSFAPEHDRFRWRDRLHFARYGLAELIIASLGCMAALAIAALGIAYTGHLAWLALVVPALIIWGHAFWFFRDPTRIAPNDPRALLSPADGVVTHIDEVDAPGFEGGRAARISIYLSVWNVHLNRMPRTAHLVSSSYFPGEFLNARHRECVQRNEQLWVDFEEPNGRRFRLKQISGAIARRLVCWARPGEVIVAGDRFGLIKFGSRTDVLLPVGERTELAVAVGDRVAAGTSVLLRFEA